MNQNQRHQEEAHDEIRVHLEILERLPYLASYHNIISTYFLLQIQKDRCCCESVATVFCFDPTEFIHYSTNIPQYPKRAYDWYRVHIRFPLKTNKHLFLIHNLYWMLTAVSYDTGNTQSPRYKSAALYMQFSTWHKFLFWLTVLSNSPFDTGILYRHSHDYFQHYFDCYNRNQNEQIDRSVVFPKKQYPGSQIQYITFDCSGRNIPGNYLKWYNADNYAIGV